jgi:ABC-type spermidine/putrescine transport system permease subunit II
MAWLSKLFTWLGKTMEGAPGQPSTMRFIAVIGNFVPVLATSFGFVYMIIIYGKEPWFPTVILGYLGLLLGYGAGLVGLKLKQYGKEMEDEQAAKDKVAANGNG